MSYSVTFDPQKIYQKIQRSTDVALYKMAEKIVDDTEQYVPMKTGMLRNSATVTSMGKQTGITISYERVIPTGEDITELLYNGLNSRGEPVKNWTTAGTGGFWLDISEEENLSDWIEYFREETRRIWRERD